MPNWCENELTIQGPSPDVGNVLAAVRKDEAVFSLEAVLPRPTEFEGILTGGRTIDGEHVSMWRERPDAAGKSVAVKLADAEVKELVQRHGTASWYDWSIAHWGTKWDCSEPRVLSDTQQDSDRTVRLAFETAWSPPIPVLEVLGLMFPTVTFALAYWEGGCGFAGRLEVEGGEVVLNLQGDYSGPRGG